jgi:hypothetical protein
LFDHSGTTLLVYPPAKAHTYTIATNVTGIGNGAFYYCTGLASVTIPNRVSSIGSEAFYQCTSLTRITIPDSVTNIAYSAFAYSGLNSVVIGSGVTNIGSAFDNCNGLTSVYFRGNAPGLDWGAFYNADNVTVYYLPGTTGWDEFPSVSGRAAVLWNPHAQTSDASFGVQTNAFGFNIVGSSNLVIVVEACTNLTAPAWIPVSTNTLNTFIGTNGSSYFSDPNWTNYAGRFYRFRSP